MAAGTGSGGLGDLYPFFLRFVDAVVRVERAVVRAATRIETCFANFQSTVSFFRSPMTLANKMLPIDIMNDSKNADLKGLAILDFSDRLKPWMVQATLLSEGVYYLVASSNRITN